MYILKNTVACLSNNKFTFGDQLSDPLNRKFDTNPDGPVKLMRGWVKFAHGGKTRNTSSKGVCKDQFIVCIIRQDIRDANSGSHSLEIGLIGVSQSV